MLHKLFKALDKTRSGIAEAFQSIMGKDISDESLETLEEQLIAADIGYDMVESILDVIKKNDNSNFIPLVENHLIQMLPDKIDLKPFHEPTVVLMVGVNGAGKTTSAAKIASFYRSMQQKVMLVGADTYRAAAVDQLKIWASRAGCDLVCNDQTNEPGSVLFDGLQSALSKDMDLVIVDTAGRLHTYDHLMAELEKMFQVIKKRFPMFKVHNLIAIDASLGQNSIIQAQEFNKHISLEGAVLTKLDGTARGGIVFSLYKQLNIPVKFIGFGEELSDLEPFDPVVYVQGLLGNKENES